MEYVTRLLKSRAVDTNDAKAVREGAVDTNDAKAAREGAVFDFDH